MLQELVKTHRIPFREDDIRMKQTAKDMLKILPQMEDASPDDPMRRSSCDTVFGPCPWSAYCWSPTELEAGGLAAALPRTRVAFSFVSSSYRNFRYCLENINALKLLVHGVAN